MKVLLCTPYKDDPDIVRGGINQWGKNILSYHRAHKDGVELIPVSFDRHITLINSKNILQRAINGVREQFYPVYNAIKAFKDTKPDVVHICSSAGLGCIRDLLLVKAAKKQKVRSVLHLHFGRLPELVEKKNWEWYLLKSVLKVSDVIVPMNKPTEITLKETGFRNVVYLPNPLSDIIIKQISKIRGIERKSNQLLYVGHVYKTKGVFELVEGCRDIESVSLRIVGKYTQEIYEELMSISEVSSKGDWIKFVGEEPHDEVLKEFLSADLFVFPSYTEGFPNVILEAMACGCPIIASNVGAIPEMLDIDNEPCGVCIQPQSSKEVHDAIQMLINDRTMKADIAERAKKRVNYMYTMPVVWNELKSIWSSN
jgi:glycosyltransferase involved in cell wall biosynthesis